MRNRLAEILVVRTNGKVGGEAEIGGHTDKINDERVGAVFTFGTEPPKERNIIVFDDFVTSGATMISMRELLLPLGYNLVFFTGINNKL